MARAPSIDQQIATLRALDLTKPRSIDALRETLSQRIGFVVAIAAQRIAEHPLPHLAPELADAFVRLTEDGAKRDPQNTGKVAIVRALHALDCWDDRVFGLGLRYVQREGWAGTEGKPPEDTAAELRGLCGLVHAELRRRDALDVLAELLLDDEHVTRRIAARALGDAGRPDASALLRYKILEGDEEAEVVAACFESLFALAREDTVPFALRFLDDDDYDDHANLAMLALGQARIADAFEPMTAWCAKVSPARRHEVGYLALALLRSDRATDWLLEVVRTKPKPDALAAVRALATFAADPKLAERLRDAIAESKDARARRELLAVLDR